MATIIINDTANKLLTNAVERAGQNDEASAIAEAIGCIDRETYLGLRAAWRIVYAAKAAEIRSLKIERAAPVPIVDQSLPDVAKEAAKKARDKAISAKNNAQCSRCEKRLEARRLMEVRAAIKLVARAYAAARKAA